MTEWKQTLWSLGKFSLIPMAQVADLLGIISLSVRDAGTLQPLAYALQSLEEHTHWLSRKGVISPSLSGAPPNPIFLKENTTMWPKRPNTIYRIINFLTAKVYFPGPRDDKHLEFKACNRERYSLYYPHESLSKLARQFWRTMNEIHSAKALYFSL